MERRLLPAGRRDDPGRLALEAEATRPRSTRATTASAASSTCSAACSARRNPSAAERGRLLLLAALHVLRELPGRDRKGEWFQLYSIGFGGIPGRPIGDGPDGHSLWPSFVNIPCEFLESYYPLRIERWETVADTGGAGLHRGGNGVDVAYRFLEPGTIAIHDDRWLTYPWGVNGGEPGARGRKWIERADGSRPRCCPARCHDVPVKPGDVLHFVTWGGGGWGDPLARDPDWSPWRCGAGWSPPTAPAGTASWSTEDGVMDDAATEALRAEMRAGPAGRAADLQHGAAAGRDPGALRGRDRAARARPAAL